MHLVIFLAKKYKTEPRTSDQPNLIGRDVRYAFLAKKYKTESRTSRPTDIVATKKLRDFATT